MRTRAHGSSSPVPASHPTDRRRKRFSEGHDDQSVTASEQQSIPSDAIVVAAPQTPTKPKKRVRFSDPGPSTDGEDAPSAAQDESSSTGLTPHIRRFTFHSPNTSHKRGRRRLVRRASLPTILPSPPSPSSSFLSQELHFAPLKQLLDERIKRRLRRNHLSEELNDIDAQKKQQVRTAQELAELAQLREQAQHREQAVKDLSMELELQRQLGIEVNEEEEQHVNALKEEVGLLRQELQRSSNLNLASLTSGEVSEENHQASIAEPVDDTSIRDEMQCDDSTSPSPHSPSRVSQLERDLSDAQAARDSLKSEIQSLGFGKQECNAEEILINIHTVFRQTRLDLEYLLPGETPGGFENGALLPLLMDHIRNQIEHVKAGQASNKRLEQQNSSLRTQFNGVLARLEALEAAKVQLDLDYRAQRKRLHAKDTQLADFETERAVHESSAHKLQAALNSYREEVTGLEKFITQLEHERATLATTMQTKLNEKQTVIRALQDEVQQRADDAEAAMDRADVAERALAHAEREVELLKGERRGLVEQAETYFKRILDVSGEANEGMVRLAEQFVGELRDKGTAVSEGEGTVEQGMQKQYWQSGKRARDSGISLNDGLDTVVEVAAEVQSTHA